MAITGEELLPRELTDQGSKRRYYIYDSTGAPIVSNNDVYTWIVANTPEIDEGGFPRSDFSAEEFEDIPGDYKAEVNFGIAQNHGPSQGLDSLEYKFNFQAPGGLVKRSLSTVYSAFDPAQAFNTIDFHGAINVRMTKDGYDVEGENLSPPPETFALSYRVGNSAISGAYQLLVESLCGKVNSVAYRGRPAGSLLLSRASGGRDASKIWHIDFGFAYSENVTGLAVGDAMTIPSKDGWDLLWTFFTQGKTLDNQRLVQPATAYVERIYYRADFNLLGLPA